MDGKISTAGSFRAMYRQYRRAHTLPFFALAASRPPADQDQLRAENARLRTSLTTVLTSSKIRSRRRNKRPDRGAESHCGDLQLVVPQVFPLSGTLWYSSTLLVLHRVQHIPMPPKKVPFLLYILLHFSTGFVVLIWLGRTFGVSNLKMDLVFFKFIRYFNST
jgi:hypothetical protein